MSIKLITCWEITPLKIIDLNDRFIFIFYYIAYYNPTW